MSTAVTRLADVRQLLTEIETELEQLRRLSAEARHLVQLIRQERVIAMSIRTAQEHDFKPGRWAWLRRWWQPT